MPSVQLKASILFVILALCAAHPHGPNDLIAKHSNLGGYGPDSGEESLDIAHFASTSDGRPLKLKVTAADNYIGKGKRNRVKHGAFGVINARGDLDTTFHFALLDQETGEPADVKRFYITFYDIDGSVHGGNEAVILSGIKKYWLSKNTELTATTVDGKTTFQGGRAGNGADNPVSSSKLTPYQLARAVTVMYDHISDFDVEFTIGKPQKRRNLLFGGLSDLVDMVEPVSVSESEAPSPSCVGSCEPIKIHITISCNGDGSGCAGVNVTGQASTVMLRGSGRVQ